MSLLGKLRIGDDPLLLIVILVPEKVEEWLQQSETELCLKRWEDWVSLRGQPERTLPNKVTVYIPRTNVFSVNALKTLMQRIANGEAI
jgi:Domain of unknown function (DUF4365)